MVGYSWYVCTQNPLMSIITLLAQLIPNDRLVSALRELETVYGELEEEQRAWIAVSPFRCPSGCGRCCEHFVPDVWEIEALYIAAQLLIEGREGERIQWRPDIRIEERQSLQMVGQEAGKARRQSIRTEEGRYVNAEEGENEENDRIEMSGACPLYRREGDFHCTVYATRPLVCRVFGFSGDRDKWGRLRYAPCRFMEASSKVRKEEYLREMKVEEEQQRIGRGKLEQNTGGEKKPQWTEQELSSRYPVLPPDMTLFGRRVEAIEPAWAGEREPLDGALLKALRKLQLYWRFSGPERAA